MKSVKDYTAEAGALVVAIDAENSLELINNDSVIFVDVREAGEIAANGTILGAVHVCRNVLEFYIDPASPVHNDVFSSDKKIIFDCATGGRSIPAAKVAMDMDVSDAAHLVGGFAAWEIAGGEIQFTNTPD